MLNADPLFPRPTLTNPNHLATLVDRLGDAGGSPAEIWRLLTENYTVDLDAVAALLPRAEPEPVWLPARN